MAEDRSAKLRNLPIRMYVAAILDGDPEIGLLYESVCDQNDPKNPIVPEKTRAPKPSEVERKGKEIVVYEEPLAKITTNYSGYDTSRTISDIPSRLENVSRGPNDESVNGGVNTDANNVPVGNANSGEKVDQKKEKKRVLLTQIKKNLEGLKKNSDKPSVPKVNSDRRCGSKAPRSIDVEDDEIALFSSRKRKVSKTDLNKKPKEDNVRKSRGFDEAESSKRGEARPKESVVVLGLQAKKQKVVPARKVDKALCLPDISGGQSGSGSVFGQPGLAKVQKVVKAEKPRLDVAKPSNGEPKHFKSPADRNDRFVTDIKVPKGLRSRSVFGRVAEVEKKKAAQAKDRQLDAARPLNCGPNAFKSQSEGNDGFRKVDKALGLGDGEIAACKPEEPIFSGLLRGSVSSGSLKMQKVIKADDPRIDVVKPSNRGAKDKAGENDRPVTATKLPRALRFANDNSALVHCKASGEAIIKNLVKADELRLNAAKPSNHGPNKSKSKAEESRKVNKDVHLSDRETGTDKVSHGFGELLRFEPSGSLAVVRAGQAKKKKAVQTKDIGADKHKASGSSRSGLGGVEEVKAQQAAAGAIEPLFDVIKETNNGPKWHAKCKASGICSGLGKCGPSASVPLWGRANSRPVDRELIVCQVNHNPADFETAPGYTRNKLR